VEEGSTLPRNLYLSKHSIYKRQTTILRRDLNPQFQQAIDRAATGIGNRSFSRKKKIGPSLRHIQTNDNGEHLIQKYFKLILRLQRTQNLLINAVSKDLNMQHSSVGTNHRVGYWLL
jgi:hypothetical protein